MHTQRSLEPAKATAVSKILILDHDAAHAPRIKKFCDEHNLVGLKVPKGAVMSVLRRNIDLGGILYSENYGDSTGDTARIAMKIHSLRPELPIIIRREREPQLTDLPEELQTAFCAAYVAGDMEVLRRVVDRYIFCLTYPNSLLRGISNFTNNILSTQFPHMRIVRETPCIVHDRIIFGEVFSLIPLESNWCRGYLMLQTEEGALLAALGRGSPAGAPSNVRLVNDQLGEIANMIWGAFKNRFIGDGGTFAGRNVQVPLVVNHEHKYISFGTENPHLCFIYQLIDPASGRRLKFYERFVFNLSWTPEAFREVDEVDALVHSGEIEIF